MTLTIVALLSLFLLSLPVLAAGVFRGMRPEERLQKQLFLLFWGATQASLSVGIHWALPQALASDNGSSGSLGLNFDGLVLPLTDLIMLGSLLGVVAVGYASGALGQNTPGQFWPLDGPKS